ncbi:DB module [Ancylostoma caninum]|uniref:DB module n=1 Tax=Ancylostoma caninum TaxID=29170 RepID=A0A368GGQ2_ANCCA|nr:DB module [Ancylostoma caninum]
MMRHVPDYSETIEEYSLPEGAYGAEERLIDGNHPSYIEDTAKTTPVEQFRKFVQPQVVVPKPAPRRPAARPQPAVRVVATTRAPSPVIVKTHPAPVVPKSIAASIGGNKDANAVFLGCCKSAKVAKSCERICNFDILNKKVLTGMFLGTDPCPQSYGLELLQCAAQSDDHTACCRSKGVHTTSAGDKCLGFCNMRPGVTFQVSLNFSHIPW